MKKKIFSFLLLGIIVLSCKKEEPEVIANFKSDIQIAEVGSMISFTDSSSGDVHSWQWVFEGGTPFTSDLQNPVISYDEAGEYGVTLTSSNSSNSHSIVKEDYIKILSPVTAKFSVDDTLINIGTSVSFFDDSEGSPTQWEWFFEGGTPEISTDQNPNVIYNQKGLYFVKLVASNEVSNSSRIVSSYIKVVDLNNGMVAHYPFSGNAEDESKFEMDGIISNATFSEDRFGKSASALSLDGDGDRVNCGNNNRDITDQLTISLWVKSSDVGTFILSKYNTVIVNPGYSLNFRTSGSIALAGRDSYSGDYIRCESPSPLNDDKWHHIVSTIDRNQWKLWVDGINMNTTESTSEIIDFQNEMDLTFGYIPNDPIDPPRELKGLLDDVILYNRVLSEEEIKELGIIKKL